MKILCPNCGVKGSADDSYCDRRVKCPKCQNIFVVQADMALYPEAAPQPVAVPVSTDGPVGEEMKNGSEPHSVSEIIEDQKIEDAGVGHDDVIDDITETDQEDMPGEEELSLDSEAEKPEVDTAGDAEQEEVVEKVEPVSEEKEGGMVPGEQPPAQSPDAGSSAPPPADSGFSLAGLIKKIVNFVRSKKSE